MTVAEQRGTYNAMTPEEWDRAERLFRRSRSEQGLPVDDLTPSEVARLTGAVLPQRAYSARVEARSSGGWRQDLDSREQRVEDAAALVN